MSLSPGKVKIGTTEIDVKSVAVTIDSAVTEDSGRTDSGAMEINWIYNRIRKITVTLLPSGQAQIAAILNLVAGKEYNITYLDPIAGERTTAVYTSSTSADLFNGVWRGGFWTNASFSAIEMVGETI